MTSEYAQTFFESNNKEKPGDPASGPLRVKKVAVEIVKHSSHDEYLEKTRANLKNGTKVMLKNFKSKITARYSVKNV